MSNSSTRLRPVETVRGGGPEAGACARVRAAGGAARGAIRVARRVPLDTSETSPQIFGDRGLARALRGRRTVEDRAAYEQARQARRGGQARAVASSYDAIGRGDRSGNVRRCGRVGVYACVEGGGCGAVHGRRGFQCHDRLCPYCAVLRGQRLADRVAPLVAGMQRALLVTLTVKNGPALAERGAHLRKQVGRLRRGVVFRTLIAGGIYIEEITHNDRDVTWHPHAHMAVDFVGDDAELTVLAIRAGMPVAMAERAPDDRRLEFVLRHQWRRLTGDSFIVDVRPLDRGDLRELCKYTAKLADIVYVPSLVAEFCAYADGRRMVIPFGTCYAVAAELAALDDQAAGEVQVDAEALACPSCGGVGTMQHQVKRVWWREHVTHIGQGWYSPCRTLEDWRYYLAARVARSG